MHKQKQNFNNVHLPLILVLALAVWRLGNMFADTNQSGPWDILDIIRHKLGVRFDKHSVPYGTTTFGKGVLCIWCNSVWFGIGYAVLYFISPVLSLFAALPFALSALALWFDSLFGIGADATTTGGEQ